MFSVLVGNWTLKLLPKSFKESLMDASRVEVHCLVRFFLLSLLRRLNSFHFIVFFFLLIILNIFRW